MLSSWVNLPLTQRQPSGLLPSGCPIQLFVSICPLTCACYMQRPSRSSWSYQYFPKQYALLSWLQPPLPSRLFGPNSLTGHCCKHSRPVCSLATARLEAVSPTTVFLSRNKRRYWMTLAVYSNSWWKSFVCPSDHVSRPFPKIKQKSTLVIC
jgi:hypothetical protein